MRNIWLAGGGGHSHVCIDVIETIHDFCIAGIVEKDGCILDSVLGYPVVGSDKLWLELIEKSAYVHIAIGYMGKVNMREHMYEKLKKIGAEFPVICSPYAYVSERAKISAGTLVMHGAIVNASATIGENCIVNTMALIEHGATIGDHSHISTGARINGGCSIGRSSFIGSGAVIRDNITIGANCIVGAGVTVLSDISPGQIYLGSK